MNKKILMIENFAEDFYKARIPLVKFLQKKDFKIVALIPNDGFTEKIKNEDIEVFDYPFSRKNKGFLQILSLTFLYWKLIRNEKIQIIHSFRFQPNLINCIANLFLRTKVICHVTGLGIAFSNNTLKFRVFRLISKIVFLFISIRANKIIIQNPDDIEAFWFSSFFKHKIKLIKGSGVDTNFFQVNTSLPASDKITFICVTRLLWEKGIREMIEAFSVLPDVYKEQCLLWIVGWADFENPRSVSKEYIEETSKNSNIIILGKKNNIKELLDQSDVYIYPSYYREGIPRSILEALSMSLPIITTDMPGCNLTVKNGNGILIAPKSIESIKTGIISMIENRKNLTTMGRLSRELAMKEFSNSIIFAQIEELYY